MKHEQIAEEHLKWAINYKEEDDDEQQRKRETWRKGVG
jgi:hypothetical protein